LFAQRRGDAETGGVVVVHEPSETRLQSRATKIYEQAKRLLCKAQLGQKLICVSGTEPPNGFAFPQHALIDEQINLKLGFEPAPSNSMIGFCRSTEHPFSISFPASMVS
jgi:hypothetical protein